MPPLTPPSKILVIQLRRIGDVTVTMPVVPALRDAFPTAAIDFLVEPAAAPVLRGLPGLNDIIVFDKRNFFSHVKQVRARRYDWVLDFMNNPRTAQISFASGAPVRAGFRVPFWEWVYTHRVDRPAVPTYAVQSKFNLLRALGLNPPTQTLPKLALSDDDFAGARVWWEASRLGQFAERVGVVPTHRHAIRRWPAAKFARVMETLLEKKDRALIVFGGPGEEDYVRDLLRPFSERVFQIPAGSLRQTAAILARCDAVLTNDSGPMHLAVAAGAPTVTVYGPTWPASWNPRIPPHRWVQAEGLSCVGCNLDKCPYSHECMEWVAPERVAAEVEAVLRERKHALR